MSIQTTKSFLLKWERGNYRPRPNDRNNDPNPTRDGVIQRTYDKYRKVKGLPLRSVFDAPQAEWEQEWTDIFEERFWIQCGGPALPEPVDLVVADAAFNSGPRQAVKFLQRAVGAIPDGEFGPETEKAVRQRNPREVCISVIGQRIRFLKSLHAKSLAAIEQWKAQGSQGPQPEEFPLPGLLNRVRDLQRAAGV